MVWLKAIIRPFLLRRLDLKFAYTDAYWMVDLKNHVFPVKKYRLIYERLISQGAKRENFLNPLPASEEDLLLVHTPKYLKKLHSGKLSPSEILDLELPFSPQLLDFALLQVGGTILAAEAALKAGLTVNIGGGFHHAFPDHGEGFCLVNDVAVTLEKIRKEGRIKRAMVVDCDVHQGNGTAAIFSKKDYVFTFSIHQMDIYPAHKISSSLDVELWSDDGDAVYLAALRKHFPRLYQSFRPDLVFYLAGADPHERDQLGGLRLTAEGLEERDKIVLEEARRLQIPVVILLAGGYAFDVEDTVEIHLNTIKMAQKMKKKYG